MVNRATTGRVNGPSMRGRAARVCRSFSQRATRDPGPFLTPLKNPFPRWHRGLSGADTPD